MSVILHFSHGMRVEQLTRCNKNVEYKSIAIITILCKFVILMLHKESTIMYFSQ